MAKTLQKPKKTSKKLIWPLVLSLLLVFLFLFGTRIYLIFNLIIGHDVLVRANIDKQNLFLYHNQSESINIKSDIIANPFCTVYCSYIFRDLSFDKVIESNNFSISTIKPITNTFQLTAPELGEGQKLYRFEIECNSKKTYLCDTTEEIEYRTSLITLNYNLTSEENEIKKSTKEILINASKDINNIAINLPIYKNTIKSLNNSPDMIYFNNKSENLQKTLNNANLTLIQAITLWKYQDYSSLEQNIPEFSSIINQTNQDFKNLEIEFSLYSFNYNNQINKTENLAKTLANIVSLNQNNLSSDISELVKEYNSLVLSFENTSFSGKQVLIFNLENKLNQFSNSTNSTVYIDKLEENLLNFNKTKISINTIDSNISIILEDPIQVCCLFNDCKPCCNESCYSSKSQLPVIFIHGHNFNKDISADNNLHAFEKIKKSLEEYGYLNIGSIFISKTSIPGILGKLNLPPAITASYYFDTLIDSKGETLLESKKDSIDTYALRLNDLIKETKKITNREKVVLVTHSMGGLVARRYLQIFGEKDIEKLILIAVPNKGISGSVKTYCSVFGSDVECSDMDEDSIFINKLNNAEPLKIPVYNIIALGCNMEGEIGDGIVKNSSAYLDFAKNSYINGTCDELRFRYFHTDLTDPDKYPPITNILKEMIQS